MKEEINNKKYLELKKDLGLSISQMAKLCGVHQRTVERWNAETRSVTPTVLRYLEVCETLQIRHLESWWRVRERYIGRKKFQLPDGRMVTEAHLALGKWDLEIRDGYGNTILFENLRKFDGIGICCEVISEGLPDRGTITHDNGSIIYEARAGLTLWPFVVSNIPVCGDTVYVSKFLKEVRSEL